MFERPGCGERGVMSGRITQTMLVPLMGYAACGLVVSVAVHLLALAGLEPPGGIVLFGGLFVLIVPLSLIKQRMPEAANPFSAGPGWMRYTVLGISIYFLVAFAIVT